MSRHSLVVRVRCIIPVFLETSWKSNLENLSWQLFVVVVVRVSFFFSRKNSTRLTLQTHLFPTFTMWVCNYCKMWRVWYFSSAGKACDNKTTFTFLDKTLAEFCESEFPLHLYTTQTHANWKGDLDQILSFINLEINGKYMRGRSNISSTRRRTRVTPNNFIWRRASFQFVDTEERPNDGVLRKDVGPIVYNEREF